MSLLELVAVCASISFTVCESKLFESVREKLKSIPFLGKLVGCGYCLSHWIAFGLVAIYRPKLFESFWPLDYFFTALAISWAASFQWAVMCLLCKWVGK